METTEEDFILIKNGNTHIVFTSSNNYANYKNKMEKELGKICADFIIKMQKYIPIISGKNYPRVGIYEEDGIIKWT